MRTALAELRVSLNRIDDVANDMISNALAALADPGLRARHETIQAASAVLLSGFLESFLKGTAEEFIGAICLRQPAFVSLPDKMRNAHYEDGADVLARVATALRGGRSTWISASPADVAERLHSISAPPYRIVWEAFADTRSNPNSEAVGAFVKKFGVGQPWPTIETKSVARSAFRTATAMKAALDQLVNLRNECAHTGTAAILPSPNDLLDSSKLISELAEAIVEVLEDHLGIIAPAPAAGGVAGTPSATAPATATPAAPASSTGATGSPPAVPGTTAIAPMGLSVNLASLILSSWRDSSPALRASIVVVVSLVAIGLVGIGFVLGGLAL